MDTTFMKRAIELAQKGLGNVSPNPMVGAIIVYDGHVIGEGYHQNYGSHHAEVNAINSIPPEKQHLLMYSDIYITLEPCNYYGKTPPCTDLILKHKIPRVIIAMKDPNPKVNGKGINVLEKNGRSVTTGIMEKEAYELNKRYITSHTEKRPFILLKWAMTSNGYISEGVNKKSVISSKKAIETVHKWRSEEDAIMVGTNTAKIDNPQLNVRRYKGKNPVRIVMDNHLRLPGSHHIFDNTILTLIFNSKKREVSKLLEFVKINFNKDVLPQVLSDLQKRNIQSVMVEGGQQLLSSFINNDLWDEARIIINDKEFNTGIKAPEISGNKINHCDLGKDHLVVLKREK